jgi:hypothetical protein
MNKKDYKKIYDLSIKNDLENNTFWKNQINQINWNKIPKKINESNFSECLNNMKVKTRSPNNSVRLKYIFF